MQFMLMFFEPAEIFDTRDNPDYWGAWSAYIGAMYESGVVKAGHGLQGPGTATTLRLREGERLVQDGPVAATKEQLGGYFVIEVPDLDTALAWGARSPAASYGTVEVRPVLVMTPKE